MHAKATLITAIIYIKPTLPGQNIFCLLTKKTLTKLSKPRAYINQDFYGIGTGLFLGYSESLYGNKIIIF